VSKKQHKQKKAPPPPKESFRGQHARMYKDLNEKLQGLFIVLKMLVDKVENYDQIFRSLGVSEGSLGTSTEKTEDKLFNLAPPGTPDVSNSELYDELYGEDAKKLRQADLDEVK
jgi:hypothetical protein